MKKAAFAFCAALLIVPAALAMGTPPKPEYKVDITKVEYVSPLATFEAMSSKKALIVSTGQYKEVKAALEAKGFTVTVVAKAAGVNAADYDCLVVVGEKLAGQALRGLK